MGSSGAIWLSIWWAGRDPVTVFDSRRGRPDGSVRYVRGDVRDEAAGVRHGGVDIIYHLSAVVGVDRYLSVPADVVEINLLGTLNLLREPGRRSKSRGGEHQ